MERKEDLVSIEAIGQAFQLAFAGRAVGVQFAGTFCALAVYSVFSALGMAVLSSYSLLGFSLMALAVLLSYPLLAVSLLVSAAVQAERGPFELRRLLGALRRRLLKALIGSFFCALVCVALCVPHLVLISVGKVGDAGEVIFAIFLAPLILLTVFQFLVLYAGLFVVPQLLAVQEGSLSEMLDVSREMLAAGWRSLLARHFVALVIALLLALPVWAAVDAGIGMVGFLSAAIIGSPEAAPAPSQPATPHPGASQVAFPLFLTRVSAFSAVWSQFNGFARFLMGLAVAFAYSLPLTVALLFQSISGALALRAVTVNAKQGAATPTSET
jgi:hypothetical protein